MSFSNILIHSSSSESDCEEDEEDFSVCFGPYTLKEAKYDIKHMKPEKIHRRHSAFGKFTNSHSLQQTKSNNCTIIKSEEESILEEQSTSFLNHLASVIDEPSSSTSTTSYYTARSNYDNTNTDEVLKENSNKRSLLLHQQSDDPVIVISDSDDSECSHESFSDDQHKLFIALSSPSSDSSSESTKKADDLNDSLDAINRFLAEEEVQPRKLPLNRRSVSLDHLTVPDGNLAQQSTNSGSYLLYQSKSAEKFHEKSKIPLFHKDTFKIPQKPVVKPNGKSKKVNLKNVVSPVGMYIKYSPKYVSVVKPGECSKSRAQLFPATSSVSHQSSSKENLRPNDDGIKIPTVIYKPAKTKILSETPGAKNLPSSIKKLMPKNTIIKHEQRTQQVVNSREIEVKLQFDELTLNDTDQFNEDISLLVNNKQPFH